MNVTDLQRSNSAKSGTHMFDPRHRLDGPPWSAKLTFTLTDGATYAGTGFCVEHAGRRWLVTCRHNVEVRRFDFAGSNDLISMAAGDEVPFEVDGRRTVVGIRIGDFIPDCAAIELREGEWPSLPKFDPRLTIAVDGFEQPDKVELRGPPSQSGSAKVKPTGWVLFQGFPGDETTAVTLRGVRLAHLPRIIQPWMISFLPTCVEGFSGGPVLGVDQSSMSLLGITTHKHKAWFEVGLEDGRTADVQISASAAVPIAPLLAVLEKAPPGNSVIDVPAPRAPVASGRKRST